MTAKEFIWQPDPLCPDCKGKGMVKLDNGTRVECPSCQVWRPKE